MKALRLQELNVNHISGAITEPPYTRSISGPQLLAIKADPLELDLPACSVAVERGVKDVTGATAVSADRLLRYSIVFQKMKSQVKFAIEQRNKSYGL